MSGFAVAQIGQPAECVLGWFDPPFNHRNDNPQTYTCGTQTPYAYRFSTADWQGMGQKFHALHLALISGSQFRGQAVAWSYNAPTQGTTPPGSIFWSILDPEQAATSATAVKNFKITIPDTGGKKNDFACAGHTWMSDGKLWVVGGTEKYATPTSGGVLGAKLTYIFDPQANPLQSVCQGSVPGSSMWAKQGGMVIKRWYPTGNLSAEPTKSRWMLGLGGHIDDTTGGAVIQDSYEAWDVNLPGWTNVRYKGPSEKVGTALASQTWAYPRSVLLSNGQVFLGGPFRGNGPNLWDPPQIASTIEHHVAPETWTAKGTTTLYREYGSTVLFPNVDPKHTDAVMIMGGRYYSSGNSTCQVTKTVEICKGTAGQSGSFDGTPQGWDWKSLPSMLYERVFLNAVLLPDATVLVVGGLQSGVNCDQPVPGQFVLQAERFRGGAWEALAAMQSRRDYHSTALLLPSGKVLLAGGENRDYDYEIYNPPYLAGCQPRPQWQAPFPVESVGYGEGRNAGFSFSGTGSTVERAVLIRPGSVTHHFDQDQRYVALDTEIVIDVGTGQTLAVFTLPTSRSVAPPGYYMLFLVSNFGIPSVARWINLQ